MSEKTLKSRIVHKHDIEANWQLATNFSPLEGEIIIYDPDENFSYSRVKVGDGTTNVNNLKFIDDNKVDKVTGKGLSTNDYTTVEKNKLAGIDTGANKTLVDTAMSSTSTNPVQNKVVTAIIDDISELIGTKSVAEQISEAIDDKADVANGQYAITTAGTGLAYTATVPGIAALTVGASFIMIPHVVSESAAPTLNVNGLGAKPIKRRLSNLSTSVQSGYTTSWLAANKPFRIVYDGAQWIVEGHEKPTSADLYGTLPIEKGGTGAESVVDARANLQVYSKDDHEWTMIYDSGETTAPVNAFANINISGYRKLMVAIKCVNNGSNAKTERGAITFAATNGTSYQFPVWPTMFTTSADTTASMGWFDVTDGWIVCSNASRNQSASNFLMDETEGGTADNLAGIGGGMMKCTKPLHNIMVSALDQDVNYYFNAGSRVIVWGCNA